MQLLWAKKFVANGTINIAYGESHYLCNISAIENNGILLVYTDKVQAENYIIVKISSSGTVSWSKQIMTGYKNGRIFSVTGKNVQDDGYIVTGIIDSSYKNNINGDVYHSIYFSMRLDKNGKVTWSKKYYIGSSFGNNINQLIILKDKTILHFIKTSGFLLKTDSIGNILWIIKGGAIKDINQRVKEYFNITQAAVDDDENIYLSGVLYKTTNYGSSCLLKFDKNLQRQWGYLFSDSLSSQFRH
ncbi:MAG: hypothetical protein EOP53_06685 [Sphingobacteriales bacterium]|nr:MAG: hypothetical protein EOP53_06685 [Sphingobacteriales bacterium]